MIDRLIERYRDALILLARILLMALFIISGFGKLIDFDGTVHYMEYVHAPMPAVSLSVPLSVDARAAQNWEEAH